MRKKPDRNKAAANLGHFEPAPQKEHDALEHRLQERTSELQQTAAELVKELDFQKVLADLSARFVNVPSDRVDREIEDAQRRVSECLGLDLIGLWQWLPEDPLSLVMTHLYRSLEGPPVPKGWLQTSFSPASTANSCR